MKKIVDWFCKKTGLRNDFACWRPPSPRSDVVSVTLIRKGPSGNLYTFSLDGEDATKWGQALLDCRGNFRGFQGLDWKIKEIQLTK